MEIETVSNSKKNVIGYTCVDLYPGLALKIMDEILGKNFFCRHDIHIYFDIVNEQKKVSSVFIKSQTLNCWDGESIFDNRKRTFVIRSGNDLGNKIEGCF